MKRKVYIGNMNISSQINDYELGFRSCGWEVMTGVNSIHSVIVNPEIDFVFNKMWSFSFRFFRPVKFQKYLQKYFSPKQRVFRKALKECDLFVFLWSSFSDDCSDLELLKKRKKKVVVIFVGSDIRWLPANRQWTSMLEVNTMNYDNFDFSKKNLIRKLTYLRMVEKYADSIYSLPNKSELALRPFLYHRLIFNYNLIKENTDQRDIPRVIHVPSNRKVKGTDKIIHAVTLLKKEGVEFEFKILENIPNEQALIEYSHADIVIGQLYGMALAKQGMEVLASGTVFMTRLNRVQARSDEYFEEIPAISIDSDNLVDKLREIIYNKSKRKKIASKGPEFIKKYHNPKLVCEEILKDTFYGVENETRYCFPNFYREKYIPESEEYSMVYNSFNQLVKEEVWYQEHVTPGERHGLKF